MAEDTDDILSRGRTAFERCEAAEQENRARALEDIRFARLGEQWPSEIASRRTLEGRPCLTINKMTSFIRQVVNDARQNKPQIKTHPVDGQGDVKTAKVLDGLIRNIEYVSNADIAYDTAIEHSVSGGFGYWRIGMDYAFDNTFDMDLSIDAVANQFSIYGDPDSMGYDSSDWNCAFVIDRVSKKEYKAKYRNKKNIDGENCDVNFQSDAWNKAENWVDDENVILAEWWQREEVEKTIYLLSNGRVVEEIMPDLQILLDEGVLKIEDSRPARSHKVTQTIMSGVDVISQREWPGKYIPIVPVYGDVVVVEGKRYFLSLVHPALDAQRMFNYWRTTATELVALAPRVPFLGRKGTFDSDAERWATVNTQSHPYLEFDGEMPQRQPLDSGTAAGALQEALNASDDMKSIMGLYDASLGARSNETSGKAILARQREGDTSTFHFIDNLTRAIRHTGRILIDLIPKVYTDERIIRVVGEDGTQENQKINGPVQETDDDGQPMVDEMGQAIMGIRDVTSGKYDLTVTSGPSFTTRREEAAAQMTELVRAFPQAAPFIADLMAKNFDWPGADEIAKRFEAMNPANQQQISPEVEKQMQDGMQEIQRLTEENQKLQGEVVQVKSDQQVDVMKMQTEQMKAQVEREKLAVEQQRLAVEMYKAESERYALQNPKPHLSQAVQ